VTLTLAVPVFVAFGTQRNDVSVDVGPQDRVGEGARGSKNGTRAFVRPQDSSGGFRQAQTRPTDRGDVYFGVLDKRSGHDAFRNKCCPNWRPVQNGDAVDLFVVRTKNYCCRLSTQSRFAFYPLRGGVTPLDFVAREIKTVHLAIEATNVQEVSARRQARLAFHNVRENKFRHFFAGAGVQNCKDVRKAANSD
jgi:hypothetical protein